MFEHFFEEKKNIHFGQCQRGNGYRYFIDWNQGKTGVERYGNREKLVDWLHSSKCP